MSPEYLGLVKTSLIDFPEEICSVLFTSGCNLRCPYCHNPELAMGRIPPDFVSYDDVFSHLSKRRNILGGVCITGGEPLLHPDLESMIREIHGMKLKVKLDTNGILSDSLFRIGADFIAMDIKTSPDRYHLLGLTKETYEVSPIVRSVEMLLDSGIRHHFRLTLVPGIVEHDDIEKIAALLPAGENLIVSQFRPEVTLSPACSSIPPYTETAAIELLSSVRKKKINVKMIGFK